MTVNEIVSLVSLSDSSSSVNSNATGFCVLILYAAALSNSLMSSSFLVVSLEFSQYKSFTSSFPVWIPFISFSSLIAVAGTSKPVLNKRGESGHPYVVPDLRGNAFSFSPLSTIFAVSLSCMTFIMSRWVLSMPTFWRVFFLIINNVEFCQKLFLCLLKWSYCFYPSICKCGLSQRLTCRHWKILASLG